MESVLAHAHDTVLSQPVDPRRFSLVTSRPERPAASAAVGADSADGLVESTVGINSRRALCHDGTEQPARGAELLELREDLGAARDVAAGAERRERSAAEQQAQAELCGRSLLTPSGGSAATVAEAWPWVGNDDGGARKKRKSFCSAEPFGFPALLRPRPRSDSDSACLTSATSPPQRRRLPPVASSAATTSSSTTCATAIRQSGMTADALLPARPEVLPQSVNPEHVSTPDSRHPPYSHSPPQPPLSPLLAASSSRLSLVSTPQTTLHLATATAPHTATTTPTTPSTPTYLTAPHRGHNHELPARNPFGSAQLPRKLVIPPFRPPQLRFSRPSSAVASSWDVPPFSSKRQCLPARNAGARGGSARGEALGGGTREGGGECMGGVWETCGDEDGEGGGFDGSALGVTWGECDGRKEREGGGAGEAEGEVEGGVAKPPSLRPPSLLPPFHAVVSLRTHAIASLTIPAAVRTA
ncbi:unnamed protein product [Closterium sp. NIES-65]|nr:unnamed protein product [Closterium sp. NIES-65]